MKLIIPMAGRGTRLRPHTHVTPKPLLPVVGTTMVERIVDTFIQVLPRKLEEAVFVLGDFPAEVNQQLTAICDRHGVVARFVRQDVALGTAHATQCARPYLEGEVIVVFADTLFYMEPGVDLEDVDVVAWTKWVEDPSRFGVAVKDESGRITDFVEKPQTLISHDTLIGIYYVKEGAVLRDAIQYLLDHEVTGHGGEYQLTDAFDRMLKQGYVFKTAGVTDWLDCGTIPALIETSQVIRDKERDRLHHGSVNDSVLIDPVYIGPGAQVTRSVVGPHVTLEAGAVVTDAIVRNSILFADARVEHAVLVDSVIGHHAEVSGRPDTLNVGDHSTV